MGKRLRSLRIRRCGENSDGRWLVVEHSFRAILARFALLGQAPAVDEGVGAPSVVGLVDPYLPSTVIRESDSRQESVESVHETLDVGVGNYCQPLDPATSDTIIYSRDWQCQCPLEVDEQTGQDRLLVRPNLRFGEVVVSRVFVITELAQSLHLREVVERPDLALGAKLSEQYCVIVFGILSSSTSDGVCNCSRSGSVGNLAVKSCDKSQAGLITTRYGCSRDSNGMDCATSASVAGYRATCSQTWPSISP